jgi:tetratricopeptide (TPR) repeat protein
MSNSPPSNSNQATMFATILSAMFTALAIIVPATDSIWIRALIFFSLLTCLAILGFSLAKEHKLLSILVFLGSFIIILPIISLFGRAWPPSNKAVSAQEHYDKAMSFFNDGMLPEARLEFQEAINQQDNFTRARHYKAKCCLKLKDFKEAETELRKVQEVAPGEVAEDFKELYQGWALYWCQRGNKTEAFKLLAFLDNYDREIANHLRSLINGIQ